MEGIAQSEEELREQAVKRLRKKRDFHTHVLMYVAVNAMLVVIWALTSQGFFWPIFPILGWGIDVTANAWDVYGRKPITEDEIRREAERLRGYPTPDQRSTGSPVAARRSIRSAARTLPGLA